MRYALDRFIPAVSRYLQNVTDMDEFSGHKVNILWNPSSSEMIDYHLKLIPGVVVSEIRTMYV